MVRRYRMYITEPRSGLLSLKSALWSDNILLTFRQQNVTASHLKVHCTLLHISELYDCHSKPRLVTLLQP
jgi:hypothetical protein